MVTSTELSFGLSAIAILISLYGAFRSARDSLRSRPVVIAHMHGSRQAGIAEQFVEVYLTNESSASAFNIRFGVSVYGFDVSWKHSHLDDRPSRINVLRPGERYPEDGTLRVLISDEALWSRAGEPIEDEHAWAVYESAATEIWRTENPEVRWEDFEIKRIARRRRYWSKKNRALEAAERSGRMVMRDVAREIMDERQRDQEA